MEFLKEHLGEELYNQVAEKLKGNDKVKLANLAEGGYVDKGKFTAAEQIKKDLETQIADRDSQLETLKKSAGDNETLKAKIAELQNENTAFKTDYENKLKAAQLDAALDRKLFEVKAVDNVAVKALLDMNKISLDGENLIGADEQIKALQDSKKWAFAQPSVPGAGGNPPPPAKGDQGSTFGDAIKERIS
jgi:hypothetical protein